MRIFLTIIFVLCTSIVFGQTYKMYSTQNYHNKLRLNTKTGEVIQIQDDGQSWTICDGIEFYSENEGRFCLSETQNMWNFIMLDTYTGRTWQVQFSVKGTDYMFTMPINTYRLAYPTEKSEWINRFRLYETQNMWNFILLDTYDGRLWQVQYSTKDFENLLCVPINPYELLEYNEESIFSIEPMTSMFQYYLINNSNGDMWKFQWSTKGDDYRWIERFR